MHTQLTKRGLLLQHVKGCRSTEPDNINFKDAKKHRADSVIYINPDKMLLFNKKRLIQAEFFKLMIFRYAGLWIEVIEQR